MGQGADPARFAASPASRDCRQRKVRQLNRNQLNTTKKVQTKPSRTTFVTQDIVERAAAARSAFPTSCDVDDDSVARAVANAVAAEHDRDASSMRSTTTSRFAQDDGESPSGSRSLPTQKTIVRREQARYDSIAKADAIAAAAELARQHLLARGWYVDGQQSCQRTSEQLHNGCADGWNVTVPLGRGCQRSSRFAPTDLMDPMFGTRFLARSGATTAWGGPAVHVVAGR